MAINRGLVCLLLWMLTKVDGAVVFRVVEPVSVNDTFLAAGYGLEEVTYVKFCDGRGDCAVTKLLMPASQTVRAVMPATLNAQSTVSAELLDISGRAVAAVAAVNVPIVSWWQSSGADRGPAALLGAPLRMFGRNLAFEGGRCLPFTRQSVPISPVVSARAVDLSNGVSTALHVSFASCYRVDVLIPNGPDIHSDGRPYDIRLSNGLHIGPGISPEGDTIVIRNVTFGIQEWPAAVFRVNFTGFANPSPNCNSIAECLSTAGAAGGGTVLIPNGTWTVCESWLFPDQVALVGAGRGSTIVRWPAWCGTPVTFNPETPNTSGGLPIVSGVPGARWRLTDMDLYGQGTGGHGYQPPLGTDFVSMGIADPYDAGGLGVGGSSGHLARVNISFDLRRTPAIQLGNAFAAYNSSGFSLVDSYISHKGSCSAQWPRNGALHVSGSTNGEIFNSTFDMGCQSGSVESSSHIFMADNTFNEVRVWDGTNIGSSNGGFEWSTIDPPHVSELQYMGNCSYNGAWDAYERWESFTTDGGADSFYNSTVTSQSVNPDGTATLGLAGVINISVFFYTWHPGDAVTVMQGPNVGQVRRLRDVLGPYNSSIIIDAPFNPPLSSTDDIISITSYRGGYTFEGNTFLNGTCFQFYGGAFDVVVSGNSFDEMFSTTEVPTLPSAGAIAVGSGLGGGGRVYATALQQEAYNVWEYNEMACASSFVITMGNLQNGEVILLPNATYNFAQIVRHNVWDGTYLAEVLFTRDHVVEYNEPRSRRCTYNGGVNISVNVSMNSPSNIGLVYRPW